MRLRTGPGTSRQVLRKVNTSKGVAPNDELVASRQTVSGDGREWYHVLYVPAWGEAEGYMPTDAWICADFVQASALTLISENIAAPRANFFSKRTASNTFMFCNNCSAYIS